MAILKLIDRLITEHGSATILKERLVLLREQADAIEGENGELRQEIAGLKARVRDLESKLSDRTVQDDFVEHRGVLFKRKPEGGYHEAVYCYACRVPMGAPSWTMPFRCAECKGLSSFVHRNLGQIIASLPKSDARSASPS